MPMRCWGGFSMWQNLSLTLIVGLFGLWAGKKLHLPVPNMLGPMFAVAAFNVFTGYATIPPSIKFFTQIINGTFIGAGIYLADVYVLRKMIPASIVNILGMLLFGILVGCLLYAMTPYDLVTMLFSAAPGGMVDTPLISHDFGAEVGVVAVMQLVRVVTAMSIIPFVLRAILKRQNHQRRLKEERVSRVEMKPAGFDWKNFALSLLVGSICGLIGILLDVPAGALIFAMIGTAVFNIFTNRGFMPAKVRSIAQLLAGSLIGSAITMQSLIQMKSLLIPALILAAACIIFDLLLSYIFVKFLRVDLATALFANAAGGGADTAIMALEYNANGAAVALMHTFRMCAIILFYPIIVHLLT